MDDLSLYQSLVLGMLFVIALCVLTVAWVLERSLEIMTQHLEAVLDKIREEAEQTTSEIRLLRKIIENRSADRDDYVDFDDRFRSD